MGTLPLVEEYLEAKGPPPLGVGLDEKTLKGYSWTLRAFAEAYPVLPYDRDSIERWCIKTKLAAGSVHTHFKNLRSFYYWLSRKKHFPRLDLTLPDLPVDDQAPTFWTQEQLAKILCACKHQWERCIVITLSQTGCRREDLCNINGKNFQYALDGAYAKVACKRTKSNPAGERIIYIPEEAKVEIIMCMGGRGRLQQARGPMTPANLKKPVRNLLKRAGLWTSGDACHAFRHSFSAEFIHNGGDQLRMDVIMGHLKGGMTRHYTHFPVPEIMEAAMKYAPRRFLQIADDIEKAKKLAKLAAQRVAV